MHIIAKPLYVLCESVWCVLPFPTCRIWIQLFAAIRHRIFVRHQFSIGDADVDVGGGGVCLLEFVLCCVVLCVSRMWLVCGWVVVVFIEGGNVHAIVISVLFRSYANDSSLHCWCDANNPVALGQPSSEIISAIEALEFPNSRLPFRVANIFSAVSQWRFSPVCTFFCDIAVSARQHESL